MERAYLKLFSNPQLEALNCHLSGSSWYLQPVYRLKHSHKLENKLSTRQQGGNTCPL